MKVPLRNLSIALTGLCCLGSYAYFGIWKTPGKIIRSDAASYYAYLPACAIYHDLSFRFLAQTAEELHSEVYRYSQNNGNYSVRTTMGLAMMEAPFFLGGHIAAKYSGVYAANGYSLPYGVALIVSAAFYFLLGLYLLGRTLAAAFSDRTAALVLLLLAWGTNATYYFLREPAMSHVFSFFLFASFLCLTTAWHRSKTWPTTVLLGLTYGLITLVRPTNGIIALVFILWDVGGRSDLKRNAACFLKHGWAVLLIGVLSLLVWVPQFLYWKAATGHWLCYSYAEEHFFFLRPRLMEVLIGFRKGWLVYTPAMGFAILGFARLYRIRHPVFWGAVVFLLANVYVISSWWCWWYGGSYGHRAFIESYVIMAFPMAALCQWSLVKSPLIAAAASCMAVILVLHNVYQMIQLKNGAIDMEFMTRGAYFESLGHLRPTPKYYSLLQRPNFAAALRGLSESSSRPRP